MAKTDSSIVKEKVEQEDEELAKSYASKDEKKSNDENVGVERKLGRLTTTTTTQEGSPSHDEALLISDLVVSLERREPNADLVIQKALHEAELGVTVPSVTRTTNPVDELLGGIAPLPAPPPQTMEESQPGAYPRTGFLNDRRPSEGTVHIGMDPEELFLETTDRMEQRQQQQMQQGHDTTDLIEARQVMMNDDLETAQPVMTAGEGNHNNCNKNGNDENFGEDEQRKITRARWLAFGCILTGLLVLLVISALAAKTSSSEADDNDSPYLSTATPTGSSVFGSPTIAPTPFLLDLPTYSQRSILEQNSTTTPQAMAYEWLRDDPLLQNLTEWRRIQRFALAAFFFSTSGPAWKTRGSANQTFNVSATKIRPGRAPPAPTNGPPGGGGGGGPPPPPPSQGAGPASEYTLVTAEEWLSYNTNECDWYSDAVLRGVPRCNETGFYRSVTLHGNDLRGTIPPQVGLLSPTLYGFNLRRNPFLTGTIPPQIAQLSHLSLLDLGQNQLTGSLPTQLGQLTVRTHVFRFDSNRITGTLPTEFLQLWNLRELVVSNNDMSGTIPPLSIPNLIRLDLQNNPKTSGTIPTTLGQLSIKRSLRLDGNPYTGQLPTEIGKLVNMTDFRVNATRITSNLPSQLGKLKKLKILDVSNNPGLVGTIPEEWRGLYQTLEYLDLQRTSISGPLPEESWSAMNDTKLRYLNIEDTNLQGTIPTNLCSLVKELKFDCEPSKLCGCDCSCGR